MRHSNFDIQSVWIGLFLAPWGLASYFKFNWHCPDLITEGSFLCHRRNDIICLLPTFPLWSQGLPLVGGNLTSSYVWLCTLKCEEPCLRGCPFQPGGRGASTERGSMVAGGGGPDASDDGGFSTRGGCKKKGMCCDRGTWTVLEKVPDVKKRFCREPAPGK